MVTALVAGLGLGSLWKYIQYADGPSSLVVKLVYRVAYKMPQKIARMETVELRKDLINKFESIMPVAELLNSNEVDIKRHLEVLKSMVSGYIVSDFTKRAKNMHQAKEAQERQRDFVAEMHEYARVLHNNLALLNVQRERDGHIDISNLKAASSLAEQMTVFWDSVPTTVLSPQYQTPDQFLRTTFKWPGTAVQKDLEECLSAQESARRTSEKTSEPTLSVKAKSYMSGAMSKLNHQIPDYWPAGKVPILGAHWSWWGGAPDKIRAEKVDDKHKLWKMHGALNGSNLPSKVEVDCVYISEALTYLTLKLPGDAAMTEFISKVAGDGYKISVFVAEGVRENVAGFFRNTHLDKSAVFCYDLNNGRLIYDNNNPIARHFAPYFSGDNQTPDTMDTMIAKVAKEKAGPEPDRLFIEADDLRPIIGEAHLDNFVRAKVGAGKLKPLKKGTLSGRYYEVLV